MEEKKYSFEGFFKDYKDNPLVDINPDYEMDKDELNKRIENYSKKFQEKPDYYTGIFDYEVLQYFIRGEEKDLIIYLNYYFSEVYEGYKQVEYCESGFNSMINYLDFINPFAMYLCIKYFESIGDKEKVELSYLLLICTLTSSGDYDDSILNCIENGFDMIKEYLYGDYLAIHPVITFNIGMYYIEKDDYKTAREFLSIGADMDYEGRQTSFPFIQTAKNKYELGLLYLNGLGVEKDEKIALSLFEGAANDIGLCYIPIMGDMYYKGLGVEKSEEDALEIYQDSSRNQTNFYFTKMNEEQEKILEELSKKYS